MRHFHLYVFRLGALGECRVRNARRYDPDLAGRRRADMDQLSVKLGLEAIDLSVEMGDQGQI